MQQSHNQSQHWHHQSHQPHQYHHHQPSYQHHHSTGIPHDIQCSATAGYSEISASTVATTRTERTVLINYAVVAANDKDVFVQTLMDIKGTALHAMSTKVNNAKEEFGLCIAAQKEDILMLEGDVEAARRVGEQQLEDIKRQTQSTLDRINSKLQKQKGQLQNDMCTLAIFTERAQFLSLVMITDTIPGDFHVNHTMEEIIVMMRHRIGEDTPIKGDYYTPKQVGRLLGIIRYGQIRDLPEVACEKIIGALAHFEYAGNENRNRHIAKMVTKGELFMKMKLCLSLRIFITYILDLIMLRNSPIQQTIL